MPRCILRPSISLLIGSMISLASLEPSTGAAPTQDLPDVKKDLGECSRSPLPQKSVDACTALLNSGKLKGPALSATHFLRGLAYSRLNRLVEARDDFAEAAKIDPDGIFGLIARGSLSCEKKETTPAISAFSEVIRRRPKWGGGYLVRGLCYHLLRQDKEAVQDLTTALGNTGGALIQARAFVYLSRGAALAALGRSDEALKDFSQALQTDSRLATEVYSARAGIHAQRREWLEAAEEWGRVTALNPKAAYGFKRRGDALDNAGHSREAIAAYTKAVGLETNPKFLAEDHLDRAAALSNLEEWPRAIEDYDEAIRLAPSAEALRRRGAALVASGRLPEALADLRKANQMDPKDGYVLLWLAIAEAKLGRFDVEELKGLAKALDPKWPGDIVHVIAGERAADAPLNTEGLNELHAKGRKCELEFYLGEIRLAQGDRDEGIRRLQAAIASGVKEYVEYQAAKSELKKLGVAVPASAD